MKVERCLYDTVIVYAGHGTSNTGRVVYRLGDADQLIVRNESPTHALISVIQEDPGPDQERYTDIVLKHPVITISESEIEMRGYVLIGDIYTPRFVPRLVVLTRSNTGWIEETT